MEIDVAPRAWHSGAGMKTLLLVLVGSLGLAWNAPAADSSILTALKGDLVASEGKKLKRFDDTKLAPVKYYGIYYSASWCGPCRKFTPDLVSWYDKTKKENPHFELIFVSSDRSEDAMAAYMQQDKMTWPALAFGKKASNRKLAELGGPGIPCLVLLDKEGKVLSHSYEGETYLGPRKVLSEIDKVLKENPASADAGAAPTGTKKVGSSSFDDFFKKPAAAQ